MSILSSVFHLLIKRRNHKSLSFFMVFICFSCSMQTQAQTNADIALPPTLFTNNTVTPKVILSLDNSGSMLNRAYRGTSFSATAVFSGFFNSAACYEYDWAAGEDYFKLASGNGINCGASGNWSGNFLNWLSMRRIDIVRNTLVGGVVKYVSGGSELTRRDYYEANPSESLGNAVSASAYWVEGENVTVRGNGRDLWASGDTNIIVGSTDNFSPYGSGARFTVCSQRILVKKANSNIAQNNLDNKCSRSTVNYNRNNTGNTNGTAEFVIRLQKSDEPSGLLIEGQGKYDFGLAVYNYNHSRIFELPSECSGFDRDDDNCNYRNSIYRDNTVNGGTLQPCFVDDASPNNNYDKCYETYAGAPPTDLIDVIEYYPLIWGTTPIAETMVEIGGYIKQVDYGRNGTDPQWYDARHTSIVPSGFSASYRVAANTTDSDTSNDVDPKWDPYYDADAGEYLPCTPIYVINLNDGEPFNDFDSNASRHPPFGSSGLASIWARNPSSSAGGAAEEEVDSVAWSLRGDCRSPTSNSSVELEGDQDVLSYFVFADLSDELEEQDARKMREAAAIGGASITLNDTETAYEFLDQPFFPGDTTGGREPFTSTSSGLDSVVVPSLPPTWDRDGDGIPDNFLLANSQAELSEKISAVLNDISRRTAASSSAAVVTNGSSIGGAIFQALYHPSLVDKTTPSKTVEWSGSLWGLFIDQNANFREDTNNNAQLDTDDLVLVYGLDSTGSVVVSKYDVSDLSTRVATTDIEGIEPIWNAVDYLADVTDPINQRAYSATASGRYIITGDKRLVTKDAFTISEARTREFLASSVAAGTGFDFNDAPWLGIDCSGQTNNECSKEVENLVNYLRGDTSQIGKRNRTVDINSDDVIGKGEMNRLLGDIVASSPKVVGAPSEAYDTLNNDTSYGDFKAQYANRRQVVYAGANDGMIHAFNGGFWDQDNLAYKTGNSFAQDPQVDVNGDPVPSTVAEHPLGAELWAYVPVNTMPHLHWLDDVNYQHAFYVDGDPQAFDVRIFDDTDNTYPGGWGTILVVPMRMGGVPIDIVEGANTYTARSALVILDITDPEVPPKLLGEFTDIDLGFTTSKPALVHNVNVSSPVNDEWSLVFGSGPNILTSASVTSGKKPYVYSLNLKTLVDDPHVSASKNQIGGASDPDGFVGDVISIDWDPINIPDGYATDSIFYGTVDIASGVETGRLMYHTPSALTPQLAYNSGQPITAIPSYAYDSTTTPTPTQSIFFGTGKLLVAQDNLSTTLQSFYGLKVTETLTAGTPIDSSDVINTSEITVSTADSSIACSSACPGAAATFDELEAAMSSLAVSGWRLDLNNRVNSTDPSGRSVGNSIMTSGLVLFTEYVPPVELCDLDGTSYLYALDLNTGTSTPFNPFSEEDGNGNSKNSTKIGNGQVKDISLFITADGDAVVVSQDSTGSPVGQKVNKPTPPIPPSTNPSGRVSWRQIVL